MLGLSSCPLVIVRMAVKTDYEKIELLMHDKDVQAWEYAVLVISSAYALQMFGQLYRDQADCENGFDALKNQWGWGGSSRRRTLSTARAVALVYNWCITGAVGIVGQRSRARGWR